MWSPLKLTILANLRFIMYKIDQVQFVPFDLYKATLKTYIKTALSLSLLDVYNVLATILYGTR